MCISLILSYMTCLSCSIPILDLAEIKMQLSLSLAIHVFCRSWSERFCLVRGVRSSCSLGV